MIDNLAQDIFKNLNRPPRHTSKIANKEMSQTSEFRLRRAHWEGKGGIACCLNIPKEFVGRMGLDKQSYLKVTYEYDEHRLIVEKLSDGGIIGNT
jgi:hypothetical protein